MENRSFNNLRKVRKKGPLTLGELAFLVGHRSGSSVAQIERGDGPPSLRTALALQVAFGCPPSELFPQLYESVEDEVMRQGVAFREKLEGKDDLVSVAKRDFVDEMAARSLANSIEV